MTGTQYTVLKMPIARMVLSNRQKYDHASGQINQQVRRIGVRIYIYNVDNLHIRPRIAGNHFVIIPFLRNLLYALELSSFRYCPSETPNILKL